MIKRRALMWCVELFGGEAVQNAGLAKLVGEVMNSPAKRVSSRLNVFYHFRSLPLPPHSYNSTTPLIAHPEIDPIK